MKRGVLADPRALGILPAYTLTDEVRAGQLVLLRVDPAPPLMELQALVSRARTQHPATRELVDVLLARYRAADGFGSRAGGAKAR